MAKERYNRNLRSPPRSTLTPVSAFLLQALTSGQNRFDADLPMMVTEKHLDTQGFCVFLYERQMVGNSN